MKHARLAWLIPTCLLTGCAIYGPASPVHRDRVTGVSLHMPSRWKHFHSADDNYVITRHGLELDRVVIFSTRLNLPVPGREPGYRQGLTAAEAAELSLGLIAISEAAEDFQVRRVDAAQFAGRPGYVAEADYHNGNGVAMRLRLYGLMLADALVEVRLTAAADGYFERALPALEFIASTARLSR